jgi:hypothetical protein
MYELPVAASLATEVVRRQFDPAAPPEPDRRRAPSLRRVRLVAATALRRTADAVGPQPECSAAR